MGSIPTGPAILLGSINVYEQAYSSGVGSIPKKFAESMRARNYIEPVRHYDLVRGVQVSELSDKVSYPIRIKILTLLIACV